MIPGRSQRKVNAILRVGFLQSAVFQIGAIAELLIEETLRVKEKWGQYTTQYRPRKRWLGTLIEFCKDNDLLSQEILKDLDRINELRVEAVHMTTEREEWDSTRSESSDCD